LSVHLILCVSKRAHSSTKKTCRGERLNRRRFLIMGGRLV
jgi:hypothetical protein